MTTKVMNVTFKNSATRYPGEMISFRAFDDGGLRDGFLMLQYANGSVEAYNVDEISMYVFSTEE